MHPAGHQTKLAARYVLVCKNGERIALMFDKGPASPANLWMLAANAARIEHIGLLRCDYPATDLYIRTDESGEPLYGRHSALRPMRELANADLVRFEIERISQLQSIITYFSRAGDIG